MGVVGWFGMGKIRKLGLDTLPIVVPLAKRNNFNFQIYLIFYFSLIQFSLLLPLHRLLQTFMEAKFVWSGKHLPRNISKLCCLLVLGAEYYSKHCTVVYEVTPEAWWKHARDYEGVLLYLCIYIKWLTFIKFIWHLIMKPPSQQWPLALKTFVKHSHCHSSWTVCSLANWL